MIINPRSIKVEYKKKFTSGLFVAPTILHRVLVYTVYMYSLPAPPQKFLLLQTLCLEDAKLSQL